MRHLIREKEQMKRKKKGQWGSVSQLIRTLQIGVMNTRCQVSVSLFLLLHVGSELGGFIDAVGSDQLLGPNDGLMNCLIYPTCSSPPISLVPLNVSVASRWQYTQRLNVGVLRVVFLLCFFYFKGYAQAIKPFSRVFSFSAGCADPSSLDSLSLQEKKRQGYIHELIETEERYVEDLQIVLDVMS